MTCELSIDVICYNLRECVVCKIKDRYYYYWGIPPPPPPPSNSIYYDDICFDNLNLIYEIFKRYHLITVGDMNTRMGTPEYDTNLFNHKINPGKIRKKMANHYDIQSTGKENQK